MPIQKTFKEMSDSIVNLDADKAGELAQNAIKDNLNLIDAIEKGYGAGIQKVGDLFNDGEFFLPELMLASQIMQDSIDILKPHLKKGGIERNILGKVVIATIEGDIHSIGKTLVSTMLKANGFEVYDLGADVPIETIVQEAIKKDVAIIGLSALLTTTMVGQKKLIDILKQKGIRNKFKVILGGAPVTSKWVKESGADGYAENAVESVKLAKLLIKN
ncbi:MAG: cobalamin B12-binding domain-containing protein [Promethearchaeota archaeon]